MKTHNGISVVVLVLAFVFLSGCASTTKISTLVEEPECMTSLEGYYHCKEAWVGPKPPAIVVVANRASSSREYYKAIQVEIVSLDDRGLTIKPNAKASSPNSARAYNPKARSPDSTRTYYELSELTAVIDEDGKVVYGSIPMKFSSALLLELYLEGFGSSYSSDSKSYKLRLTPNERFGYCLPSGIYKVAEVRFIDGSNNVALGVNCPDLRITVNGGRSNYIGDLFLNFEKSETPDSVRIRYRVSIPYKIISTSDAAGWMFGILGTVLTMETSVSERELLIGIDDAFTAQCKRPLTVNIIKRYK